MPWWNKLAFWISSHFFPPVNGLDVLYHPTARQFSFAITLGTGDKKAPMSPYVDLTEPQVRHLISVMERLLSESGTNQ